MARELLRRKSSIPAYIHSGENALEVAESDLRWRRSSHAAISAMLPSHGAFHSDTGLVLSRSLTDPQRRRSIIHRRKSVAALRGDVATELPSSVSACRQLLKGLSGFEQMAVGEEDDYQTLASIRSMTATISVKRKYRPTSLQQNQQQHLFQVCRRQQQTVSVQSRDQNQHGRGLHRNPGLQNDKGFPHNDSDDSSDDSDIRRRSGFDNIKEFDDNDLYPNYDRGRVNQTNFMANERNGLDLLQRSSPRDQNETHYNGLGNISNRESYQPEQLPMDNRQDGGIPNVQSRPHSYHGNQDDPGVDVEPDYEEITPVTIQRDILRRRSRKHTARPLTDNGLRLNFNDGVKTLVLRRKTMIQPRSQTNSTLGRPKSRKRDSDFVVSGKYQDVDLDEDKLPSNRNAKTVSLKRRLELLHSDDITTHDMANILRDQLITRPQKALKGPSLWKYQLAMTWLRLKNFMKSLIYQLELWSGAFKTIEGHFGTATLSYFRFLRWLMFLNLLMSIIILGVTFLPFLALKPTQHSDFASSVNGCLSEFYYKAQYFSQNYSNSLSDSQKAESTFQSVLDVLQGTGWLENTELFYGAYHNRTYTVPWEGQLMYNMSLAYLCAVGIVFLLCFLLLVKNSAKGLKESVLTTTGGSITHYCNRLFGAWDYCISQPKTAGLKHKNILQQLKNELEYQQMQWKKEARTAMERARLYTVRLLINIVVVVILAASLYLIYYSNEQLVKIQKDKNKSDFVLLLLQYLPSITITFLNVIVPLLFNRVVIAEDYMPNFSIKMTLTRTVLLRLASLGVLMLSLYNVLAKHKPTAVIDIQCDNLLPAQNTTFPLPLTMTVTPLVASSLEPPKTGAAILNVDDVQCWETYVGQQIYKLVVLNFIVVILVTLVWEFPRKLIYSKFHTKVKLVSLMGQQEFDLSKSVLDLVYLQTLCWLGLFFSPFIPAICLVKCFIFFYIKKSSLLHNCLPMQQYGTSKSNSLFMMVLLLSFGLSAIPIVYMISSIQPSQGCGPFRVYSYQGYVMFNAISDLVSSWPTEIRKILFILGTGGFMAIIAFLLCLLMYYFWAVSEGNQKMAEILRDQLKMEGQDKQFLLARVNEVLSWEQVSESIIDPVDPGATQHSR